MTTGHVKLFSQFKHFGVVERDEDGLSLIVEWDEIIRATGDSSLKVGESLEFETVDEAGLPKAVNVRKIQPDL